MFAGFHIWPFMRGEWLQHGTNWLRQVAQLGFRAIPASIFKLRSIFGSGSCASPKGLHFGQRISTVSKVSAAHDGRLPSTAPVWRRAPVRISCAVPDGYGDGLPAATRPRTGTVGQVSILQIIQV